MRRWVLPAAAVAITVLVAVTLLPRRPPTLACPGDTARADAAVPSGRQQWCERAAADGTRVRQGPYAAFYPDGRAKIEGAYLDGAADGHWVFWGPDGRKREEGGFRQGREEGPWTRWWANGQPQEVGTYRDGIRQGRWSFWHGNGQKAREGAYRDGGAVGPWSWWNLRGDPCPPPAVTG